jgi:hypothetical protein
VKFCRKLLPVTDYYDGDRFFTTPAAPPPGASPTPFSSPEATPAATTTVARPPLPAPVRMATPLLLALAVVEISDGERRRAGARHGGEDFEPSTLVPASATQPKSPGERSSARRAPACCPAAAEAVRARPLTNHTLSPTSAVVFAVDSIPAVFGVTLDPFGGQQGAAARGSRAGGSAVEPRAALPRPYHYAAPAARERPRPWPPPPPPPLPSPRLTAPTPPARPHAAARRAVVYSSNMFAILSLRSLYSFVSTIMTELRYLDKAVAVVLAFIGAKMIAEFAGVEVATDVSLLVVGVVLGGGVAASLLLPDDDKVE